MDIIISPRSDTAIYTQIVEQITAQILQGKLPSGAALPPIRTVARQLEISVITVKKAWEELERGGLIEPRVGRGTVVAAQAQADLDDKRLRLAQDRLAKDLDYYRGLGLSLEELIALVRRHYD